MTGIEPIWASEVEPFPMRVTTKRLPDVKHYGDINKINGALIPPVDIITAGFCCQDLSVAGKRAGLRGERSGLFYQIPRIIKEMRTATNGEYPKYAVLENVPGMYSSAGGGDFLEVLNELIQIKDETLSVPMPEKGKWSTSGEIVGDGFSIGWRTLDAQFWGVAQRRRRCYIVVDFTGGRAGEILFNETRLRGNPPQGCFARQGTAGSPAAGTGSAVNVLNDQGGAFMDVSENVTGTLRSQEHGHQPIVFEPGAMLRLGGHCWQGEPTGALRADMGDNRPAVAIPINTQVGLRSHKDGDGTGLGVANDKDPAYTLQAAHPHAVAVVEHTPCVYDARGNGDGETVNTITGDHNNRITDYTALVMNERQYALTVSEEVANTLTGTDFKGTQCVFEKVPATFDVRLTSEGTLNARSHVYGSDVSRSVDRSGNVPGSNQGGIAVVAVEGNGSRPSHRGDGYGGEVSFTLNSVEKHSVCYQDQVGTLCASDYKFPQQQQIDEGKAVVERVAVENHQHGGYREIGTAGTLKSCGGTNGGGSESMVVENRYVVRRLTPTECALLQGFPPDWCAGLETHDPTEEDISFWSEVWETHRIIQGKSAKPKSRNQIVKWLKDPHSDSAEYKMWGNGVALPCVAFVLDGIVSCTQRCAAAAP